MNSSMTIGERFKDLVNVIPHHGFVPWQLVSFFYEGITSVHRQFIDMMCNGKFLSKKLEEALDYFESLVENAQSWDIFDRTKHSKQSVRGEKYALGE